MDNIVYVILTAFYKQKNMFDIQGLIDDYITEETDILLNITEFSPLVVHEILEMIFSGIKRNSLIIFNRTFTNLYFEKGYNPDIDISKECRTAIIKELDKCYKLTKPDNNKKGYKFGNCHDNLRISTFLGVRQNLKKILLDIFTSCKVYYDKYFTNNR